MPTKIEWSDESWNPITGCTPVSEGCRNCYAERMARRLAGWHGYPEAPHHFDVMLRPERLEQPLRWRKPRMIFVCSMSDLFHKDVPDSFIFDILEVVAQCPRHTFQVLTKRPKRMAHLWRNASEDAYPNLWLGVSVENQEQFDSRWYWVSQISAAVLFVSCEPLLGLVKFNAREWERLPDWVICGGESGPGARPMDPNWTRLLRDQCQAADTPFFLKQWGEWLGVDYIDRPIGETWGGPPVWLRADGLSGIIGKKPEVDFGDGHGAIRVGRKRAGRLLDGQVWDQFPVSMPGQP